jgi:hypothetical protein
VLDVVQLGEFAMLFRGRELLKLVLGLPPQIVAVHEEENALCARMLDEPITEITGGKGFPAAAGHLNQGARTAVRERILQVTNRFDLRGPEFFFDERWHVLEARTQRRTRLLGLIHQPVGHRFGAVERKHEPAARIRLHEVRKPRLNAGALIAKRQGLAVRLQYVRKPDAVFLSLNLVSGKGFSLFLGFNYSRRSAIHIKQVVGETVAGLQRKLANGYAATGGDIRLAGVLNHPTGSIKELVDGLPRFVLGLLWHL